MNNCFKKSKFWGFERKNLTLSIFALKLMKLNKKINAKPNNFCSLPR